MLKRVAAVAAVAALATCAVPSCAFSPLPASSYRRCSSSPPVRQRAKPALRAATAEQAEVVAVATAAGRAASKLVSEKLGAEVTKTKASRGDLLTEVDVEVQKIIEAHVSEAFPSHAFLGEESVASGAKASTDALNAALAATESDWLWICDPIDGTTNFVQGMPMCGISIGIAKRHGGEWRLECGVIVDPFRNETFAATVGGGATLTVGPAGTTSPISCGVEELEDAVVATGFAPNPLSLRPMLRGIAAVGEEARTVRMLGSAAIMLAWVAVSSEAMACHLPSPPSPPSTEGH